MYVIKAERTTNQKQFRAGNYKAKCKYGRLPRQRTCEFGIRDGRGVSSAGRRLGCTFRAVSFSRHEIGAFEVHELASTS